MPSFEVQDQDGNIVKSEDLLSNGKKTQWEKDHCLLLP